MSKEQALKALHARREMAKSVKLPRNEDLPAGSPMYFRCIGCGVTLIEPEGYMSRNKHCPACADLIANGWMQ